MNNEHPVLLTEEQTGGASLWVDDSDVYVNVTERWRDPAQGASVTVRLIGHRVCSVEDVQSALTHHPGGRGHFYAFSSNRTRASLVLMGLCAGVPCLEV